MCASYPNCNIGQCRKIAFERPVEFAANVMQWAAEHPEPVYPTLKEWLKSAGFVTTFSVDCGEAIHVEWDKPIPADIAEKLGLQPKEGT